MEGTTTTPVETISFKWDANAIMYLVRHLIIPTCSVTEMMNTLYEMKGCTLPVTEKNMATARAYRSDWSAKTKQLYQADETCKKRKTEYENHTGSEDAKKHLRELWLNSVKDYEILEGKATGSRKYTADQIQEMKDVGRILLQRKETKRSLPSDEAERGKKPQLLLEDVKDEDVTSHPTEEDEDVVVPAPPPSMFAQMERIRQDGETYRLQLQLSAEKLANEEMTRRENFRQQEETKRMEMMVGMVIKLQSQT
jgi:hypothetical protein